MKDRPKTLLALPFALIACLCALVVALPVLLILIGGVSEGEQYLAPFVITVVFAPPGLVSILLARKLDPSTSKKLVAVVICGLVCPVCVYSVFLFLLSLRLGS